VARARNIKPAIMTNDELAELDPLARLLFIYLWMLADRSGRLEDRPKKIKGEALPYDNADVDAMLSELQASGFILRYQVEGHRLIQIVNFAKHQTPHIREADSSLPEPVQSTAKAVPRQVQGDGEALPRSPDSLIPDSLIPDSLIADSGATEAPAPKGKRLPAEWMLPDAWREWALNEFKTWLPETVQREADRFKDFWTAKPGKDGVKSDWLATWRNWCRGARNPWPLRGPPQGGRDVAAEAARLLGFDDDEVIDA